MYAIVDIETTGGFANGNGITELAIILHNGIEIEGNYHTLINPFQPIPRYISALTGITNEMVADAPSFEAVAPHIHSLLNERVFVAHNVNFDYSFLKHNLEQCGYSFQSRKLCTVRMARKVFAGLPSYSLGNLCRSLNIPITDRHRANGDAMATAVLFGKILEEDREGHVAAMLKGRTGEQFLPPHLPLQDLEDLPNAPGVYYFENNKKEVIYVGKALNLRKRVRSHFSNNDTSKRKQDFLRQIYHIRHTRCSSELMALILESQEIRRIWPLFNRSQKQFHHKYGLYTYEDNRGYIRLIVEKKRTHLPAIYTFNYLAEGQTYIRKITAKPGGENSVNMLDEPVAEYNQRIKEAVAAISTQLPSFALVERNGIWGKDYAVYVMDKGRFYGMGILEAPFELPLKLEDWKQAIPPSDDNDYIRGLVYQFAEKNTFTRLNLQD